MGEPGEGNAAWPAEYLAIQDKFVSNKSIVDKNLCFLVVDDSNSMRKIISRTIREMGFEYVFEADDGTDALQILERVNVGFVVSDWNMPRMKGIDLLNAIRNKNDYKDIPFLMVSAESKMDNIMEAIREGVTNYLPKPFTPDMLRKKIEVILNMGNGNGN